MWKRVITKKICAGLSGGIVALALGMLGVSAGAQSPETATVVLQTGLQSYSQGAMVRAMVSEIDPSGAVSDVKIDFRNVAGRIVASVEGKLRHGEPVVLDMRLPRDSGGGPAARHGVNQRRPHGGHDADDGAGRDRRRYPDGQAERRLHG